MVWYGFIRCIEEHFAYKRTFRLVHKACIEEPDSYLYITFIHLHVFIHA